MFFFSALLLLLFLCYVFLRVHLLRVLNKKRVMFSICPFVRSSVRPSVRLFVRRYQTYEYEFWIRINRTCCKSAKRFMGQGDKTIKRSKIKVTGSQNRPNSWPRYFKKRMNRFRCNLTHGARGWNDQIWGSGGQRSRSHDAEVTFGGLAEASFSTSWSGRFSTSRQTRYQFITSDTITDLEELRRVRSALVASYNIFNK